MRNWLIILGLTLLVVVARSINLLGQPLYLDEGIYISWAHLFTQDPSYAYVSLQDGKTPLFFWLISWLHPFIKDSLLTARLISVIASGITAFSWMVILMKKANFKTAQLFGIFYLILPYGFLIEKLGFVDSLLTALASLSLLFLILSFESLKKHLVISLIWGLLAGVTLAIGYMTKTTARLILVSEFCISLVFFYEQRKSWKRIIFGALSLLILFGVYKELTGYMQVGAYRFWDMIGNKESELTFSIPQIINLLIHRPYSYFEYGRLIVYYTLTYFSGFLLLVVAGKIWILKKRSSWIWLLFYTLIIYFGVLLSGRVMASRYIFLAAPPVVALASLGGEWILSLKNSRLKLMIPIVLIVTAIQSLLMIIQSPWALYTYDDAAYFHGSDLTADGLPRVITYIQQNHKTQIKISGTWGVVDGSQILLQEHGIKATQVHIADATKSAGLFYTTDTKEANWLQTQPNVKTIELFPRQKNHSSKAGLFEIQ